MYSFHSILYYGKSKQNLNYLKIRKKEVAWYVGYYFSINIYE